jgi:hypothetical protein
MKKHISLLLLIISRFYFSQNKTENYVGVGFQKGTNESWKTELIKNYDDPFSVNYPDLECSGIWKIAKNMKDIYPIEEAVKYLIAEEKIDTGLDKCMNNGWILLVDEKLSKTTKRFYVFETENHSNPYAFGFLEEKF